MQDITATTLAAILASKPDIQLIDVRTPQEFAQEHLEQAQLLPLTQLPAEYTQLDPNQKTVVYCRSGSRSTQAARFLSNQGFSDVSNVKGGLIAWKKAHLPTT